MAQISVRPAGLGVEAVYLAVNRELGFVWPRRSGGWRAYPHPWLQVGRPWEPLAARIYPTREAAAEALSSLLAPEVGAEHRGFASPLGLAGGEP